MLGIMIATKQPHSAETNICLLQGTLVTENIDRMLHQILISRLFISFFPKVFKVEMKSMKLCGTTIAHCVLLMQERPVVFKSTPYQTGLVHRTSMCINHNRRGIGRKRDDDHFSLNLRVI